MIPKVKIRGFEVAKGWEDKEVRLPEKSTAHAAGYDFYAPEDIVIPKRRDFIIESSPFLVPTGVKAYMKLDEFLLLANRSSNPKRGLQLANSVGIVDSDFYGNETDDGHIRFAFWNKLSVPIEIKKGEKIGQGIFLNFLGADNGVAAGKRRAGFGSTGL